MKGEADWFDRLGDARNIPAFLHGSYVRGCVVVKRHRRPTGKPGRCTNPPQHTLTNLNSKIFGVPEMMSYTHYRTVQCELYVPLEMFNDSKHLVRIMLDVAIAMQDLHDRRILHRDISVPNIMITTGGGGYLIDLDTARDKDYVGAMQVVRTRTWQFMSTRLFTEPGKAHELCDDLESLWFVLLYEALHFVKHNEPPEINMDILFNYVWLSPGTGIHTGGLGKRDFYGFGRAMMTQTLSFNTVPFTGLIRQVYALFRNLYEYHGRLANGEKDRTGPIFESAGKLDSCLEIQRLFREALTRKGGQRPATK